MKKVLLYSGGMDSWLIDKLWKPDVRLYIDTGTRYAQEEMERLPPETMIERLDLSHFEREDRIIPLRNLYFVMVATNYGDEICLGATYGDRVLDKSHTFARMAGDLLTYLYQPRHWTEGRKIRVNVDYKSFTKAELLRLYLDQGGDMDTAFRESFSCYNPGVGGGECWRCKPCARKTVAFLLNGYHFADMAILDEVGEYLVPVMEQIDTGKYGRGEKEEREIKEAYRMIREALA